MFSRRERLPREKFPTILKSGKRSYSPNFMAITSNEVLGYAVIIPKKSIRLSVKRHRLKRQVLEILREVPLPGTLIIFPRFGASSVSYEDMKKEISRLLTIKN